jgi:hypothetical protein
MNFNNNNNYNENYATKKINQLRRKKKYKTNKKILYQPLPGPGKLTKNTLLTYKIKIIFNI